MLKHRILLCKHQSTKYVKRNKKIIGFILICIILLYVYTEFDSSQTYLNLSSLDSKLIHNDTDSNSVKHTVNEYYKISPIIPSLINGGDNIKSGAIINGLDFCDIDFSQKDIINPIINALKQDIYKYEFVMLKNQCKNNGYDYKLSPYIFTLIAKQFGVISEYGSSHKANPKNTNITVLSNNHEKGKKTTGSKGWHIDGTSEYKPNSICFQHIISVPNKGNGGTQLISSIQLIELLKNKNMKLYQELNKLYMIAKGRYIHPTIAIHPMTKKEYMVMHTAYTQYFIEIINPQKNEKILNDEINGKYVDQEFRNKYENDDRLRFYSKKETEQLLDILYEFIETEARQNGLIYVTDYEKGDLLIRDNLALLHKSHPSAQMDENQVGLRVMWRLTIEGQYLPSKFL